VDHCDANQDRRAPRLVLRNDLWTTNVIVSNFGRIEHAGDVAHSGIEAPRVVHADRMTQRDMPIA
jgi:hypothetical protein